MKLKQLLLVALLPISIVSCNQNSNEQIQKPTIEVDQKYIYSEVGTEVKLPSATAFYGNEDITTSVTITIYYNGQAELELENSDNVSFIPSKPGEYTAHYQAKNSEGILSDIKQITINVGEKVDFVSGAPKIRVDKEEVVFGDYENIILKEAKGTTFENNDVSDQIKVRVVNSSNNVVYEGKANIDSTITLNSGTYNVIYSLVIDGKEAVEQSYVLTITSAGNVKPILRAPTSKKEISVGETISISSGYATDFVQGDISSEINYRIQKSTGEIVVEKTKVSTSSNYKFNEAGTYNVIYSVSNSMNLEAEEVSYEVEVKEWKETSNITLDGVIDEKLYSLIPSHRFGIGGNVKYYFYSTDEGLYIAADVEDSTLIYSNSANLEEKLNYSDGLEFTFNPFDITNLYIQNTKCFRVRVGLDGSAKLYKSQTKNDQWAGATYDFTGKVVTKSEGKSAIYGEQNNYIADKGYTMELMLPWDMFEYSSHPSKSPNYAKDYIRIGLGHRDIKHTQHRSVATQLTAAAGVGENNVFYNGMNLKDRPKVATEGLAPALYSKLYLTGDKLGLNPTKHNENVILDGYMEKEFWDKATTLPFGETANGSKVDAKVYLGTDGVYAGIYIEDSNIISEDHSFLNNYGIFSNDCIDLRVVTEDEMDLTALPVSTVSKYLTNSKVISFDPSCSAYMQMLQPVGAPRTHMQFPFEYATSVQGTIGYDNLYTNWTSNNIFIANCNISDKDMGWGVETFIPYETINLQEPQEGETLTLAFLLALYDRDASPTGAKWKYGIRFEGSNTVCAPQTPNTYFRLTKEF